MSKKRKSKRQIKDCQNCANCIYICEGDYYCDEANAIILTDFTNPTEHYFKCKGERWESEEAN